MNISDDNASKSDLVTDSDLGWSAFPFKLHFPLLQNQIPGLGQWLFLFTYKCLKASFLRCFPWLSCLILDHRMLVQKYYFYSSFLSYCKESMALREGDKPGSHGSFENPEISFKKEETPNTLTKDITYYAYNFSFFFEHIHVFNTERCNAV